MVDETFYDPPPIQGYKAMSQAQVDLVNTVKRAEQTVLAMLRNLADDADIDPRWYAIGKTDLEKGFMAVCRSIARPNGD